MKINHATPLTIGYLMAANNLWLAFFQDPDGNSLALMSESPRGYNPVSGKFGE